MLKFLLVSPKAPVDADFAGIREQFGGSAVRVGPIATATVAAFAPAGIEPLLLDESLEPIDFEASVDFVGITANVSQARRAVEIANGFRARGRTVIIGGPHITLDFDAFAGSCDVAVTGEFEAIAADFYADMLSGALKPLYDGGRPDLTQSPVPAWELFDNDRAISGIAQTSRGCPFECNYCDVIQYLGRRQRHKTNEQVITEVQRLYELGYNRVQLADDNFTVYRKRATSLLEALRDWNGTEGRDFISFSTQASIDIAKDPEMLRLCAEAGLSNIFVGVETINEESLRASKKRQNLNIDIAAQIGRFVSHGIQVEPALMVGFDADTRSIFEQQCEFGMDLPVGPFKVSSLVAPVGTPLYDEMRRAGRLDVEEQSHFPAGDRVTNILPAQMSRNDLRVGTRWLISRLYHPEAFSRRLRKVARTLGPNPLLSRNTRTFYNPPARDYVNGLFTRLVRDLVRRDPEIAQAIGHATDLMRRHPDIQHGINEVLGAWLLPLSGHIQKGSYDPAWARLTAPPFGTARSPA